ncbi:MAG: ATP-binding protein [Chlorobi bacterium]|nr:ATP-binding protein [Chlorobiota bacterium]
MKKELILESKIENITFVENLIDDISKEFSIGSEVYGNILVAVIEAVNNAILHGNKLDISKKFGVVVELVEEQIKFIISDEGSGFDFKKVPDPTHPGNVEKPDGRGVFLMNHLADKVEYNDKGNILILHFNIK